MYKPGGQGRIQGDLGGLWLCPWWELGGGCCTGITAGGTEAWGREQPIPEVTSSETFPDLFPVPSPPCWPCPHPATPSSLAASAGGSLLCCGDPSSSSKPPGSILPQPPAFHIKAKRDSPNLRPPQHCLHKSSAYFCIKSSSFQSYSNARNKRLLWLHVMLKDRWRRAQCLCSIQMSDEIIPVIPNWCCICL